MKLSSGQSLAHESAQAQISGRAHYVDDLPEVKGTLYAAPICSPVAHGILKGFDAEAALGIQGVVKIVAHGDIQGDPLFASFSHDEPIFAMGKVEYLGQVIGLVVARDINVARRAASLVRCHIDQLPALLTIAQARKAQSFISPTVRMLRGEPTEVLAKAKHRLQGSTSLGGQEHFYLEGQVAYVLPQEQGRYLVYSSTQHPGEVQHWVSHALGLGMHAVTVETRRMGGGFGGKETQAGHIAVWAALGAQITGQAVKLRLDRDDDFMITGKRHPFEASYEVGFDDAGRIQALKVELASLCGFSADLSGPVNDRAMFHIDNAYYLEHLQIESLRCKTNTQSSTAFRGFGGPQGMFVIETILGEISRALGKDALAIRRANFYGVNERNTTHYGMRLEDNIISPLVEKLVHTSHYEKRRLALAQWNQSHPFIKRGLALTPVKFGISFTATHFNQGGALVHVYTDGTVLVNHGGTEMGQGLHTKVCQTVADVFGLPFESVKISASDTSKVPNASATAASAGTDLNARAAQIAAQHIKLRLIELLTTQDGCELSQIRFENGEVHSKGQVRSFKSLAQLAHASRVQLWSDGFYKTPKIHYDKQTMMGRPFYYFSYGAACVEVIIDAHTGENRVTAVDILHDVGTSINPAIDIGQIEGGFVQGMGWLTTEELVWDGTGKLSTHAPSTYKIPTAGDLPEHFNVALWPEANPEENVFGSKAVGEPPLMLALAVIEALRDAVASVSPTTQGAQAKPVDLNAPATAPEVLRAIEQRRTQSIRPNLPTQ